MKNELFRKNLKNLLVELDMSQQELADKMGIQRQQISYWIRGKNTPTDRSLKKIADALGKPINFFLENSELSNNVIGNSGRVNHVSNEKSGGAVQRDEFDGFKREVAKDIEILKLQIDLLKKDLLIERNKK
jgi:transcriptional regulator with XRE-family HTH domain